jgi:ribosomal protein S27E
VWEERFEQRYGFWRSFVDDVVNAYLDCGRFESGFARVRCSDCGDEFLVATSCQKRGFCPSCGAKRAAAFAAFLADEVLEEVGHAMWTFSLPKMIRPYFIHHPELRGKLCRAAYETVQEMMAAAAICSEGFRSGMVAFTATAGDLLNPYFSPVFVARASRCCARRSFRPEGRGGVLDSTSSTAR